MNPYQQLNEDAFWATAVARRDMLDISHLWEPKFRITPKTRIATFGSCFAQHISKALRRHEFRWLNSEPAPKGFSNRSARQYNYGVFTCRTGNIYTTSLLLQWVNWALGVDTPPEECWQKDGRFYDPFRPAIEPNGFASREEVVDSRAMCIEAFHSAITDARLFVFTLGLTESWIHRNHGYEYPMCPGTVSGDFDKDLHIFKNQDYATILQNLKNAVELMRRHNPSLRFLLTVSPVPLTATMSGKHVLVATTQSKSNLRAVAGYLAENKRYVDYFPSYEIISSVPYRGVFYEENLRSVAQAGVDHVMANFFDGLSKRSDYRDVKEVNERTRRKERQHARKNKKKRTSSEEDVICDEELLEAFGAKR